METKPKYIEHRTSEDVPHPLSSYYHLEVFDTAQRMIKEAKTKGGNALQFRKNDPDFFKKDVETRIKEIRKNVGGILREV